MPSILVVTSAGDIHAVAFRERFAARTVGQCHLFHVDTVCNGDALSWHAHGSNLPSVRLIDSDGEEFDIDSVDAIWWRRFHAEPLPNFELTPAALDLVKNDSQSAVLGAILTSFRGACINHPIANRTAENKLLQLRAAQSAGLRIPETLVSNCPDAVREFCERLDGSVIVKPVRGSKHIALFTRKVTTQHLADNDAIRIAPAAYQELVPGETHLRIHCFGNDMYFVRIASNDLDWRENLEIPFELIEGDAALKVQLRRVLDTLGLRMGIVDMKVTPDGEPVWLEVNAQGQFLFSEGLTGFSLTDRFVDFMLAECSSQRNPCALSGV